MDDFISLFSSMLCHLKYFKTINKITHKVISTRLFNTCLFSKLGDFHWRPPSNRLFNRVGKIASRRSWISRETWRADSARQSAIPTWNHLISRSWFLHSFETCCRFAIHLCHLHDLSAMSTLGRCARRQSVYPISMAPPLCRSALGRLGDLPLIGKQVLA
jgi:hypothetical protein